MWYSRGVAYSTALLLLIWTTASSSSSLPSSSYWSRAVAERTSRHDDNDHDDADLQSLHETLSGWERGGGSSRGLSSSPRASSTRPRNDEDVDFKRSQDWWKDPLAEFDGAEKRNSPGSSASSGSYRDIHMDEATAASEQDDLSFNLLPVRPRQPAPMAMEETEDMFFESPLRNRESVESPARASPPLKASRFQQAETQTAAPDTPTRQNQDNQVAIRKIKSRNLSLEFPVLLASMIPAPVRQILTRIPAMQVLAVLAIGRQIYQWRAQMPSPPSKRDILADKKPTVPKKPAKSAQKKQSQPDAASTMDHINLDSETDVEEDFDEIPEAFRNNPRTRAVFEKKKRAAAAAQAPVVPEIKPEVAIKPKKATAAKPTKKRVNSKSNTKMMPVLSGGWTDGIFGPRRPSARQLLEKVSSLEQSYQQAQQAKSNLEQAYEQANWQLQESQTEFDKLKQTTKYLQAQLRDNEEMLEKVVEQEQRKSKEELMQMKEAMIKVVEREREAMREEFIKQAAELEQVWKQSTSKRRPVRSARSNNSDHKSDDYSSI